MRTLQELMAELFDADQDRIQAAAREHGTLSVRLAMLGIASSKKASSPFWYGYPPGVFISYKWDGEAMRSYVLALASHLRGRGYSPFLDVEELDARADNYFSVPQFIVSLQECVYYLLLLTERTADYISARGGQTSWIFDEWQHAVRLVNAGKLVLIPLLLEEGGTTDLFTREMVVDLSGDRYDFSALDALLPPGRRSLAEPERVLLARCLDEFDRVFLQEKFPEALAVLLNHGQFSELFDHRFRLMLYALYSANEGLLNASLTKLHEQVPEKVVAHLYSGYCAQHGIPNRVTR